MYRNYFTTIPAPISRPFLHISLQIHVNIDCSVSAIIPPPQTQSIVGKNAFDYFFPLAHHANHIAAK